ncbi:MAG: permease [Peptostreptococcales bacterium]|jgi:uncharacterized membrane protein YraQ (UPF0718 family)
MQFESGEEEFQSQHINYDKMIFPKKDLEQQPARIVERIYSYIQEHLENLDEIWVEWNGVVPFSQLRDILLQNSLRKLCKIQKVIHMADGLRTENLLGRTGAALPEQIANSDLSVVRNVNSIKDYKRIHRMLETINPGIAIYEMKNHKDLHKKLYGRRAYEDFYKQLSKGKEQPLGLFFVTILLIVSSYFIVGNFLENFGVPFNIIINIFIGIILQAFPFLLIGVILSSMIQVFVPQSFIERRFPKSLGWGMLVAILGGFCLPVCDCASIPIFRSLVRKGIPLPVAITFMTAAPVINPVVILSTYYAFSANLTVVMGRVVFGIVAAITIGISFTIKKSNNSKVLSGGTLDQIMCSCGCYEDSQSITSLSGKVGLLIRHSQVEFFSVGKYLVIGSFIASIIQALGTGSFITAQSGAGLAISIIVMMAMSFVLSLCSSSDAVVARSFANQFPLGAIMGFLVFGPMMDIKNVMMLSAGFSKGFIARLLLTSFVVCFTVVFIFARLGGI